MPRVCYHTSLGIINVQERGSVIRLMYSSELLPLAIQQSINHAEVVTLISAAERDVTVALIAIPDKVIVMLQISDITETNVCACVIIRQ